MILTIDIGNTRAKAVVFDGDKIADTADLTENFAEKLATIAERNDIKGVAYAAVKPLTAEQTVAVEKLSPRALCVTGETPAPVSNCYRSKQTLGADRWAAVVGARSLQPEGALLIIDAGTCLTFDFVSADNNYLGGGISPGMEMRLTAMHEHTARLPLILSEGDCPVCGDDTETALRSGAVNGLRWEMEGCIRHFLAENPDLTVFLTGGTRVKPEVEEAKMITDQNLVARGLKEIYEMSF